MINWVFCDRVEPQAWRNGGGRTRELLVWPPHSPWHLRISVADIETNGPFSAYPDVDRWFAVVEGEGVDLRFSSQRVSLGVDSTPLAFKGEDAPECALHMGATRDLNLMVQRGQGQASMLRARPGVTLGPAAALRALFCADAVTLEVGGAEHLVAPYSLCWSSDAGHHPWCIRSALSAPRAWWMEFFPAEAR